MKTTDSPRSRVAVAFARSWRALCGLCTWLGDRGHIEHYDLSIADEIFAIFAGVTLFVSYTEWLNEYPVIIITIVTAVALTVVPIIVAINQSKFWIRLGCYSVALVFAYAGVEATLYVSAHDLSARPLNALPIGVMVWMSIREVSVFIMSFFKRQTSN